MDKKSTFKGLTTAGIAITLAFASKNLSITEEGEPASQAEDTPSFLTITGDEVAEEEHDLVQTQHEEPAFLSVFFGPATNELPLGDHVNPVFDDIVQQIDMRGVNFDVRGCMGSDENITGENEQHWFKYSRATVVRDELIERGIKDVEAKPILGRPDEFTFTVGQFDNVYAAEGDCPPLEEGHPYKGTQAEFHRTDIIFDHD